MSKIKAVGAVILLMVFTMLMGCSILRNQRSMPDLIPMPDDITPMTQEEAFDIALKGSCAGEGMIINEGYYNDFTRSWWLETDIEKEGCNPMCVVREFDRKSEINWMCTGLVLEDNLGVVTPERMSKKQAIQVLIAGNYNVDQDMVAISFDKEGGYHLRGRFQIDGGNIGLFLAAKQDDVWELVFAGGGAPSCEKVQGYDFPAGFISGCKN